MPLRDGALLIKDLCDLGPKELCVRQPRAQNAVVTGNDRLTAIVRFHIGNNTEARRQRTVIIQQRKIFLVRSHRCDQHFVRHIHEFTIDRTEEDDRPLDQSGDFVQ